MSPEQRQILREAPRYRGFFSSHHLKGFIPDTPKARAWAVAQGATHFEALAFHRLNVKGKPAAHRWGDFHCRLFDGNSTAGPFLERVKQAMAAVLEWHLAPLGPSGVKVVYLGSHSLGLTIPAAFFRMADGAPFLREYYRVFAEFMGVWVGQAGTGVVVAHDAGVHADNVPLAGGRFAVPMTLGDLFSMTETGLAQACRAARAAPSIECGEVINPEIARVLLREIPARSGGDEWASPVEPLFDQAGASTCGVGHSSSAVKCAIKLLEWLRVAGITEFRRRDALRVVDGSFTLGDGVGEGLRILAAHGHIHPCPALDFAYPGRRSHWFVVNPASRG